MGRSQESFSKREKEKKKKKKKEEKLKRKEERQASSDGGGLDNMIAYVDKFGNPTDQPPEDIEKEEINAEDIALGVPKREYVESDKFKEGKLDHFNTSKGYGFIRENGSGESYFVHINEMEEEMSEGNQVVFEIEKGPKGWNAVRVKKGVKEKPKEEPKKEDKENNKEAKPKEESKNEAKEDNKDAKPKDESKIEAKEENKETKPKEESKKEAKEDNKDNNEKT